MCSVILNLGVEAERADKFGIWKSEKGFLVHLNQVADRTFVRLEREKHSGFFNCRFFYCNHLQGILHSLKDHILAISLWKKPIAFI